MVRATARIGSWRLGDDFSPPPTRGRPLRTRAIRDARASPATSACLAPLHRARASLRVLTLRAAPLPHRRSPLVLLLVALPAALALLALILQVRESGAARHRAMSGVAFDPALGRRVPPAGAREKGRQQHRRASDGGDFSAYSVGAAFDPDGSGRSSAGDGSRSSKPGFALTREGLLDTAGGKGKDAADLKVMISTTTSDALGKILDWAEYHRLLGVDYFYMFVEGKAAAPEVVRELGKFPGMTVWAPSEALDERRGKSRIWGENWLGKFFDKPCNNELFVRQSLNMEIAIETARREGVDWHVHIDTDELLNPAGQSEFGVKPLFANVPDEVDLLVFPNYEACPEHDQVKDPFREVTLFKRNFDHVVRNTYMENYRAVTGQNPNYFLTYGNGESAARIQDGLRPNGAHRFHNYLKQPVEIKAAEASVLHYTYTTFDNILSRKNRCDCPKDEESLKQCFILEFDRVLYTKWDEMNEREMRKFYNERVVYRDEALKAKILSNGLFQRIYTPQLAIEGLRAARAARAMDALSEGGDDESEFTSEDSRRGGEEDAEAEAEGEGGGFIVR